MRHLRPLRPFLHTTSLLLVIAAALTCVPLASASYEPASASSNIGTFSEQLRGSGSGGGFLSNLGLSRDEISSGVSYDTSIVDSIDVGYGSVPGATSLSYDDAALSLGDDAFSTADLGDSLTGGSSVFDSLSLDSLSLDSGYSSTNSVCAGVNAVDTSYADYEMDDLALDDEYMMDDEYMVDDPMLDDELMDDPMLDADAGLPLAPVSDSGMVTGSC